MNHENIMPPSVVRESIHAVRQKLPFLPIMLLPQKNLLVGVDNTGEVLVDIPDGAILVMAKGISNGNIFMSVGGDSLVNPVSPSFTDRGLCLHSGVSEAGPFYCGNIHALTFSCTSATVVYATLHFWTRLE